MNNVRSSGRHRPPGAGWRGLAQLAAASTAGQHRAAGIVAALAEVDPMENAWEFMRGNFLSHCVWDGYDAIIGRVAMPGTS